MAHADAQRTVSVLMIVKESESLVNGSHTHNKDYNIVTVSRAATHTFTYQMINRLFSQ